jgi:protein-tyrosine-phosphatase
MTDKIYNVLFLCTGNSARSIMAEAILNVLGKGRFQAFSAGSNPSGQVQPIARALAQEFGYDAGAVRSKSWNEFALEGAPEMDIVITVCDNAAGESCPVWPGHPALAHWGVPDPVEVTGDEDARRRAYLGAFSILRRRTELLLSLPLASFDRMAVQAKLREIGGVGAE